ncbi:MAG: SPOR domain-containing protein, partial [Candidatus Binatia bacterium]
KNATRLKKAVARKGYRARIRTIRHGRRHWYRVSIGTYASRRTAQRVANRVKKVHRGLAPLIVASN